MQKTANEKPILFSAPMVRAILDGRKTQTRRVIKPEHVAGIEVDEDEKFAFMHAPSCGGYCDYACAAAGEVIDGHIGWTPWGSNPRHWGRLWVRETWAENDGEMFYKATYDPEHIARGQEIPDKGDVPWHPSIHMHRNASRITLEITGVRVERVQDISEEDAIAEGAQCAGFPAALTNKGAFGRLWESLNGKRGFGWKANPWVWVIEFKRVKRANC